MSVPQFFGVDVLDSLRDRGSHLFIRQQLRDAHDGTSYAIGQQRAEWMWRHMDAAEWRWLRGLFAGALYREGAFKLYDSDGILRTFTSGIAYLPSPVAAQDGDRQNVVLRIGWLVPIVTTPGPFVVQTSAVEGGEVISL
jgi:hypothetical protein